MFPHWIGLLKLSAAALSISVPRVAGAFMQNITVLSPEEVQSYGPYTYYASAGYCKASSTLTWACGLNCKANPHFIPFASGGDGNLKQWWYVGYDPILHTVITSHQGTNPEEILPLLTDADIIFSTLNSSLFPGINAPILVHSGFAEAHARTAVEVLCAVKGVLGKYESSHITTVGHSLGAALALLDAVYLPLHLPANITITSIGYGLPRVGNQAFANYVDAHVTSFTHVNNEQDPIPILPGRFLGYAHAHGEVHIETSGQWESCPGQDNPSKLCIVGAVPEILDGDLKDHDGPYDGIRMGC